MEKRKINMENCADMHDKKLIKGKDGTEITVRDHIPYSAKEAMAVEIINNSVTVHEDACVYYGSNHTKIELYMIAKYYTDIETDGLEYNDVADYLINNGLSNEIKQYIAQDYEYVQEIYVSLFDSLETIYCYDSSITRALRTSFGFLFNGEDITESLAKAEVMKDTVYDAISAFRSMEKEKSEKIDNGTVKIGGNIINFAKKQE